MTDDLSAHPHHRPGDRSVALPEGTRVWSPTRGHGVVMPYEADWGQGAFPVRWDNWQGCEGIWERCDRSTVTAVTPEAWERIQQAKPQRRPGRPATVVTVAAAS